MLASALAFLAFTLSETVLSPWLQEMYQTYKQAYPPPFVLLIPSYSTHSQSTNRFVQIYRSPGRKFGRTSRGKMRSSMISTTSPSLVVAFPTASSLFSLSRLYAAVQSVHSFVWSSTKFRSLSRILVIRPTHSNAQDVNERARFDRHAQL
jgi:hypothetical protein